MSLILNKVLYWKSMKNCTHGTKSNFSLTIVSISSPFLFNKGCWDNNLVNTLHTGLSLLNYWLFPNFGAFIWGGGLPFDNYKDIQVTVTTTVINLMGLDPSANHLVYIFQVISDFYTNILLWSNNCLSRMPNVVIKVFLCCFEKFI